MNWSGVGWAFLFFGGGMDGMGWDLGCGKMRRQGERRGEVSGWRDWR